MCMCSEPEVVSVEPVQSRSTDSIRSMVCSAVQTGLKGLYTLHHGSGSNQ